MALAGPIGKDNLNISFRLHSKSQVFDGSSNTLNNARLNLVTSASSFGLVFVGSSLPEIIVLCMKDLESPNAIDSNAPVRKIPMPSTVTQLATNCDGSILAVDVKINGIPHIQLYSVGSFLTPSVQKLREFRVSTDNASSTQLCWNPVINSALAVCTESGGLGLYALKDQDVEFHSIDPSLKAKCCCWSPKGKQIVAGFANGKLIQFNMEMKPARTIECPQGIVNGSFDTIAIQWLSTYQFAVAFLKHAEESRPVLHIVNAPKAGPLQFFAYNDVCYSTSEVRPSKIYLQYIQQWGLLLIASANCVDISFLRITKLGDIPEWTQEFANDQFPGELPLTPEKEESFPIGFELDTACSGRLLQEDGSQYPVMPMIHLLSTYGVLCSFYFVNTTPSYVDICSPPRPIDPRVQSFFTTNVIRPSQNAAPKEDPKTPPKPILPTPLSQSTPAASFGKSNLFSGFGTSTQQQNAFSGFSLPTTIQQPTQPQPQQQQQQQQTQKSTTQAPAMTFQTKPTTNMTVQAQSNNEPLITIPPTYNPPATQTKSDSKDNLSSAVKINDKEEEQVYIKMIQDEMKAFELELSFIMEKSRALKVNIGTKDESAEMRRQLEELDELKKEATETIDSLRSDVQTNRLVLTESFSMAYEAKSKCDQAKDDKSLIMTPTQDRTSKRTLEKLKKMITNCEMQVQISVQLLSSQWANYQETLSKNKKNKMHFPSLEGVYQTLTKQQEIIYNLSGKLKMLKSKLGIFDDTKKQKNSIANTTIESLSDSIISMSLIDQVQNEKSKLTDKKLKNLRNYLEGREVVTIRPQRPQLPGLNSEIIIEKKMKAMKSIKKPEPKKQEVKIPSPPQAAQKTQAAIPQVVQNIPALAQTVPKLQPSETVFNISQKNSPFTALPTANATIAPTQLSFGKKSDDQPKSFSFGQATTTAQPFALNLSGTSLPQPTFGFSTTDKKKEDVALSKAQTTQKVPEVKPQTTISNANVSVSANFSLSLPSKTTQVVAKETQKIEEKKPEEVKATLPTTNESTTFTFSLSGKKETPSKPTAQGAAITFGSAPSNVSDTVKSAFSFGAAQTPTNAFSFSNLGKTMDAKTSSTASSTTSPISFGSSTATPFSGFSVNNNESNKSVASTAASITNFGSALSTSKPVEDNKTTIAATVSLSPSTTVTTTSSTGFSFGSLSTSTTESKSSPFSFASFGASIISSASASVPTASQPLTTLSSNIFGTKPTTIATTSVTSSKPAASIISSSISSTATDSVLSGLKICSPEISKPQTTQAITTSPFGSSNIFAQQTAQSRNQSIFGSNVAKPITPVSPTSLSSPTQPTVTTTSVAQSSTPSIFGNQTTTQASSIFGSLSLDANKTQSPTTATVTSPSTNIFGSTLVKPDQSVFGQSATIAATSASTGTSGFGNIFSNAAAAATTSPTQSAPSGFGSIFGGNQTSNTSSSNIFGSTTPSTNIFAQANQTQQQSSSGSIFGQVSTANTSGSLFSQSSFSSPSTGSNIFGGGGGSTTQQAQSPFGSTSIFGSSSTQPQSSSIFGNSSFGSQPSANIFGGSSTTATSPQTQSSIFGSSNIFAQQSPQNQSQPTFGGSATFSNTFGSSGAFGSGSIFGQQQQSQPVFGGGATFGSPKSSIFATASSPQQSSGQTNIFEQLGSQQTGNLFGGLSTQQQQPQQQSGFSGSAFSSWR